MRLSFLLVPVLALTVFVACGEDESSNASGTGGTGSNTGGGASSNEVTDKLKDCPVLSLSSDPTASACLEGTYQGTTVSGDVCTLEIGQAGEYTFSSPVLNVSHTPPGETIFIYDHSQISGFEQITWKVSDPISTETWYELDFEARYGTDVPQADRKIQIDVTEYAEGATQSTSCTVEL
jgi:hypothetical protein